MKKTELFFPYVPKPKGRPKFGRGGHAYTPKTTADYEKSIKDYYSESTNDYYDGAISVKLVFNMPIPSSASKKQKALMESGVVKCTKHNGDIDNLVKAVLDALNEVAFKDDCLITKISAEKKYTSSTPGTLMIISEDVE